MSNELLVPEGTNLIINDTQYPDNLVRSLFDDLTPVAKVKWVILSATEMTTELGTTLAPALYSGTAFLFPGEGSQYIKSGLNLEGYSIPTSRRFIGNRPTEVKIQVPQAVVELIKDRYATIAIVEDVVATGETVRTIKDAVEWKIYESGLTPRGSWIVYAWLKQWSAKTPNMEVVSCLEYRRRSGKVPVNSLSTFISATEKGKVVRSGYAQKYFEQPKDYIEALNRLSKQT